MQNKYFLQELQEYINNIGDEEKLFYGTSMMSQNATKYGFESHDLRAALSHYVFDKYDEREEAVKATQEALGHDSKNTSYKKYLGRKINKSGTQFYV
jgi:integrase